SLAGGLAFCVRLEARSTEDIDILIMPEDWPLVRNALAPLVYQTRAHVAKRYFRYRAAGKIAE
ncbi:MAG: hypothetical protein NTX50_18320, partial [Candidatus Sumerlaeota bacterium]|nr:hypothetical protein [Candidatus Sumerlaeota bacterium]